MFEQNILPARHPRVLLGVGLLFFTTLSSACAPNNTKTAASPNTVLATENREEQSKWDIKAIISDTESRIKSREFVLYAPGKLKICNEPGCEIENPLVMLSPAAIARSSSVTLEDYLFGWLELNEDKQYIAHFEPYNETMSYDQPLPIVSQQAVFETPPKQNHANEAYDNFGDVISHTETLPTGTSIMRVERIALKAPQPL